MTLSLDVLFTESKSAEERVNLEDSEDWSILAQSPVMNSWVNSRPDTLEALRVRRNVVKDPVLRLPGLECHAHSQEILITHHLCCETQKKKSAGNDLKLKTNINNLIFNLSYYETPGQSDFVSSRQSQSCLQYYLFGKHVFLFSSSF